jgi:hypothetical protein
MIARESDQLIVLRGRESRPQNRAKLEYCFVWFGLRVRYASIGEGADESTQPVQSTSAGRQDRNN